MTRPAQERSVDNPRLKALLEDLNQPLEIGNWTATPYTDGKKATSRLVERVRKHRQHRKQLKRARRAAASVYKVTPRRSARKRASLMIGAGAMSLAAFTGPATQGALFAPTSSAGEADEARKPAPLLRASDEFKQALIEEEGIRYTVYRDVAGYPTVGVGHLVLPKDRLRVGDRISQHRAMQFLEQDIAHAERGVRNLVGDLELYQHEFDALLDLVFNVGIGNVSESRSPRLNAAIDAGDYEGIAAELDYSYAAGKIAGGLENRSERRANIFLDASYEDPRTSESRKPDRA